MATVPNRYLEDLTGLSPNNKVLDDVYTLNDKPIRAVAVRYGPFYGKSVVLYDDVSNVMLERNVDYSCVGLLPELTSRSGQGVYDAIMITKKNMSNRVRLEYQVVGGHYGNQATTIAGMVETLLKDNRGVDWVSGVYGKPHEWGPVANHPHWLQDVVGFGPLVAGLDRIANAITIGQAPVFNFLLSRVNGSPANNKEIEDGLDNEKYITPAGLRHALLSMNFNAMYLRPFVKQQKFGTSVEFNLHTNIHDAFDQMYWSIEHEGTLPSDFKDTSGYFSMTDGEGKFSITLGKARELTEDTHFKVIVRRDTENGPVMIKSYSIKVLTTDPGTTGMTLNRMQNLYTACCLYDATNKDPIAMFFSDKDGTN